jgi:hypothetical protein
MRLDPTTGVEHIVEAVTGATGDVENDSDGGDRGVVGSRWDRFLYGVLEKHPISSYLAYDMITPRDK